jgi:hypothetical protein
MLIKNKIKKSFFLLLLSIPFLSAASEKVLLKINSDVREVREQYTLSELLHLPQYEVRTNTPWTNEMHTYSGPYLEDVFALAGVRGNEITLYALDHYQISFNFESIKKYKPILALAVDSELLTVRTKGPIWVVLPLDDYSELNAALYHDYMIWQLVKINVNEKSNDDAL